MSAEPEAFLHVVDGAPLEIRRAGPGPHEAPTLVFLHEGLGSAGLCSEAAALELARGAREQFGAEVGLSVSACTTGEQQGQVAVGLVTDHGEHSALVNWPGDAGQVRERAASAALNLAFKALKGEVPA